MQEYHTKIFDPAREYLLSYHEDRESIIRLCRDINSYSKKIIFAIHRIIKKELDKKVYDQLFDNMKVVSKSLSLVYNKYSKKDNFLSFKSTISNSVEEMIEAFTFGYYIMNEMIMTYDTFLTLTKCLILSYNFALDTFNDQSINYCIKLLLFENVNNSILESKEIASPIESLNFDIIFIMKGDYLMGLFDLTGEIMRYSITNLVDGTTNTVNPDIVKNLKFMKAIHQEFTELFTRYPDLSVNKGLFSLTYDRKGVTSIQKKLDVLRQSVNKVENMLCDIYIRRNEIAASNIDIDDYA